MIAPRTKAFINKVCFELRPECGDYITTCKCCGKGAWLRDDIKHKLKCEVTVVLKELSE